MPRTLNTCAPLPASGYYITLPFPDIAKPVSGDWTINLSLRKTLTADGKAYVMVRQGDKEILTTPVTLTTSFQPVIITIPKEKLELITGGICHVSSLEVIIFGTVIIDCCPGVEIPRVLKLRLTNDTSCECCETTTTLTYDDVADAWLNGNVKVGTCGTSLGVKVYCNHMTGEWKMDLSGCNTQTGVGLFVTSCDPFNGTTGYAGAMGVCCNHPEPVSVDWAVSTWA